jgi:hypothetical protein
MEKSDLSVKVDRLERRNEGGNWRQGGKVLTVGLQHTPPIMNVRFVEYEGKQLRGQRPRWLSGGAKEYQ